MIRQAIVWRHGRTPWNNANRFQGHIDIPLDEVGVAQAAAAAQIICPHDPALIVTSDLSRAAQTAQALTSATGVEAESDTRLREAHAGNWQGMTHAEIQVADADLLRRWRSMVDVRPGTTGENRTEVGERVGGAIAEHMVRVAPGEVAVFVTHGGAARAAVGHLLRIPPAHWHHLAVMRNCGWAVLEVDDAGEWRLQSYNLAAVPVADDRAADLRDAIV